MPRVADANALLVERGGPGVEGVWAGRGKSGGKRGSVRGKDSEQQAGESTSPGSLGIRDECPPLFGMRHRLV